MVEHSASSNKSDVIDLGLWWCRRTDWQLRSTPRCDGKWLVRASTDRLIVFRSGAGCWPGRFGAVRRGQPPPDNYHLARLSYCQGTSRAYDWSHEHV